MGKVTVNDDVTKSVVKALNLATGVAYCFSPMYRCGVEPRHMTAPPNFTDETAFTSIDYLKNARVGDVVFIEWAQDRFYALDIGTNEYIPGPTVWRKSKILEHTRIPVSKKSA